jgi:hypothetical protein
MPEGKPLMKHYIVNRFFPVFLFFLLSLFFISVPSCTGEARSPAGDLIINSSGHVLLEGPGRGIRRFDRGLPEGYTARLLAGRQDTRICALERKGVYLLKGGEWTSISDSLFRVRSNYENTGREYRPVSALALDENDPGRIVLATKHDLYMSEDQGQNWKRISPRGMTRKTYITSLALSGETIRVGTAYRGIFQGKNNRFYKINRGLPGRYYSREVIFHETVESLAVTGVERYPLAAGLAFGGGVFLYDKTSRKWVKVKGGPEQYHNVDLSRDSGALFASLDSTLYRLNDNRTLEKVKDIQMKKTGEFRLTTLSGGSNIALQSPFAESPDFTGNPAANRRAIYTNVSVIKRKFDYVIQTLKAIDGNAVVIDMKDDTGYLYYPTKLEIARDIKAIRSPLPVKNMLKKLHDHNIYTIARVVVFKDRQLYRAWNYRYAIRNRNTGGPWKGLEHEYWVDPHSSEVQKYNVSVARELEELGFDEIQFDYIRFPNDGPIWLCRFPYRKEHDTYRSEALLDFLERAKDHLGIPVSVDIYGFNSWYNFGNWIGQDIEAFSRVVDAICPMVYPSHFGTTFYVDGDWKTRSYRLIHDGGIRGRYLSRDRVPIRPYLQSFKLLSPTYGPGYIRNQVKGALESGCSGYTFWNAGGDYGMLRKAFSRP